MEHRAGDTVPPLATVELRQNASPILLIIDIGQHILKRCTRSLSKPRSYEETMRCRFDPAPEPMPAEATHLSPPCRVSTHRSASLIQTDPQRFWITGRRSPVYHR